MSAAQNVKINEQLFGSLRCLRGVNKGVLIGTMGRFLSGNVSDSFRRVQYLFRLYSLPHRAAGWKSRPRMRGQFLPRADLGWHTLQNPTLTPHSCCQSKIPPKLENQLPLFVCAAGWSSCVRNAFCRGLWCVWSSVEVFVVITLQAMASAGNAPCPPQLSTRRQPPDTGMHKKPVLQILLKVGVFYSRKLWKLFSFSPFTSWGRFKKSASTLCHF